MKTIFILFLLLISVNANCQSFEIPKEGYPFYDIIEWKGFGGILLNRDPSGLKRKINMTLISDLQTSTWNQSFNPKGENAFYISSDNARYVYFLDNLELDGGKFAFSQLSSAGSVKSSIATLTSVFKKLGEFDMSEMKLIDIVTTDKALVHIFRYHNTKEKKYTEIGIFMTHHNLISYAAVIGETQEDALKDDYTGYWKYIGFTGDQIFFATHERQTKQKGWAVKEFNSKAELKQTTFIIDSEMTFEPVENKGFGTIGRNYLSGKNDIELSILTHYNGKFYITGIVTQNGKRELKSCKWGEGKWEVFSSYPIDPVVKAKNVTKLGIYPLNEGLGVKVEQNSAANVVFMPYEKGKEIIITPFTERVTTNPSRMIIKERKQDFVVYLPDRNVFFTYSQLNNTGSVKFEFIKR